MTPQLRLRLPLRLLLSLFLFFLLSLSPHFPHAALALPAWQAHGPPGAAPLRAHLLHHRTPARTARALLSAPAAPPPLGAFETAHPPSALAAHPFIFATALCADHMEPAVTVLHESLLAAGHRQPLLVLATRRVAPRVSARLAALPLLSVFRVHGGPAEYCGKEEEKEEDAPAAAEWTDCAHLKLLLFAVRDAHKIVFLEHDTVVLRNLAPLAEVPPFSAVREAHVGLMETAVMVLAPDEAVHGVLRDTFCVAQRGAEKLSDHEVLRTAVPDEAWNVVADTYNVPQEHMDALWHRRVDREPAVIHFKGSVKPWNWFRMGMGEPVSLRAFKKWCDVAERTEFACGRERGAAAAEEDAEEMEASMQPNGWSDKKRLTVLLSTFHRPTWKGLVRHYASFKVVSQVVLVWHDPSGDPPLAAALGLKVVVWQPGTDSLNNRFFAPGNVSECVYVCDDDMKVSEAQLLRGFQIWKGHARRLVGYFPRRWMVDSPHYSARVRDGYNVVLTKGLFTHRYFLYMYVHLLPRRVLRVVDLYNNCEDLLFNMMVSGYHGAAALHVVVDGVIVDLGHGGGISARGSHFSTRFRCVRRLVRELGLTKAPLTVGSYSEKPLKNKERE